MALIRRVLYDFPRWIQGLDRPHDTSLEVDTEGEPQPGDPTETFWTQELTSAKGENITWTFSEPVEYGQFVTGDYFVIGPVVVTDISRPNVADYGVGRDGSEVNPKPWTAHGYDDRPTGYSASLNMANSLPYTMGVNESLISSISRRPEIIDPRSSRRPALQVAAILTCLENVPPVGSFRPPYCGTDKPIYSSVGMRTDFLYHPDITLSTGAGSVMFSLPWIDHTQGWQGDDVHPADNMPNYGGTMARQTSLAGVRLINNAPTAGKMELLRNFVQMGIDNYEIVKEAAKDPNFSWSWGWVGGSIGVGRKLPILFAGIALESQTLLDVATDFNTMFWFQEDGQTFYLTQADRDMTYDPVNCSGSSLFCHPGHYDDIPLGTAVWAERAHRSRTTGYNYLPGNVNSYRQISYPVFIGAALCVRWLGIESAWNYDPFVDFVDYAYSQDYGMNSGYVEQIVLDQYQAYRDATPLNVLGTWA